jgi:uncharacterized protein
VKRSGYADLPLHGGRVPLKTYDESISVLRRSLDSAKLAGAEKRDGFARLDKFVRALEERAQPEADFHAVIAHERSISPSLNGRTVFDDGRAPKPSKQMSLDLF